MTAIRLYRKKHGLTQKELALLVGVVPNTICQYESGARKPDVITLKKIAKALECSTDELLAPIKA